MKTKHSSLGKNLSALLGSSFQQLTTTKQYLTVAIDTLQPNPFQPRLRFDNKGLQQLADSIKNQGLLQPLLVRPSVDQNYEIIAGERRWRASKLAGLTEIAVVVEAVNDEAARAMALIENLQREDLNPIDQARAMQKLVFECAMTHQQIANLLSKSRASVSNMLRLLNLHPELISYLEQELLDMGHARALLLLDNELQCSIAKKIIANNLSVRETEKLVQNLKNKKSTVVKKHKIKDQYNMQIHQIEKNFNVKIALKNQSKDKGSIIIKYTNNENLQTFLKYLQAAIP